MVKAIAHFHEAHTQSYKASLHVQNVQQMLEEQWKIEKCVPLALELHAYRIHGFQW
jgi:hypothetical protein